MSTMQPESRSREERLGEAVFACVQALETGRPLGEAEVRARYPDLADDLLRYLEGRREVEQVAAPLRHAVQDAPGGGPPGDGAAGPGSVLGDFRLLREVGRGGMGVVYEAEQVSLRRRVALKVLPLAAALDPRALQRFQNEARAAAGLHHTHIVPVYAVGCERGVPFYAMQFIDGRSLADLLRELRQPPAGTSAERTAPFASPADGAATVPEAWPTTATAGGAKPDRAYFRRVAEWGVQAAEALDHAHQLGVVHRDVKPANLLVDGRGQLWVTDFGLAQVQQGEAGLTRTGDLVGTLRYMSPEQALAKRVPIDHRTDVYSLGATLYELLTLRPVLNGNDRQELLRQIASDEPQPPRKVSRAVPAELEVIVFKALEKAPQERYATAQEVADDLRRWLDDRPIQARRPSVVQRLRKWGRRHRPLVEAMIWFLGLATVVLAVSTLLIAMENQRKAGALRLAEINGHALTRAQARWKAREERLQKLVATLYSALDEVATDVDQLDPGRPDRTQRAVAEKVSRLYEQVSQDEDPNWWRLKARQRLGWAYVRLGNARAFRHNFPGAKAAYDKAADTFSGLAADCNGPLTRYPIPNNAVAGKTQRKPLIGAVFDHPEVERRYDQALALWRKGTPDGLPALRDYRREQARFYEAAIHYLSNSNYGPAEFAEVERRNRQVITLREAVLVHCPSDYECRLELIENYLGAAWGESRLPEVRTLVDRAVAHEKKLVERAKNYPPEFWTNEGAGKLIDVGGRTASWLRHKGDRPDAVKVYRMTVAFSMTPRPDGTASWIDNRAVAEVYMGLGELMREGGQAQEAEEDYRQATAKLDKVLAKSPTAEVELAGVYNRLGMLFRSIGRFPVSEKAFRTALERVERTKELPRSRWETRSPKAVLQNDQAWLFATYPDATLRDAKRAVALAQQAVQIAPEARDCWNTLGVAQYRAGNWSAALEALSQSVRLRRGGDSFDFFFLAMAHWQLGDKEQARRWYDRATDWMQKNTPKNEELCRFRAEAADLLKIKAQDAAPDTKPPPAKTAAARQGGA